MLKRLVRQLPDWRSPKALVLMYHRIAAPPVDVWDLAVTPARFAEHLQVLRSSAKVLSTAELLARVQTRTLEGHSVAITFDDGYEDNFTAARPLLERVHLPATFFVVANTLGQGQGFWWDELEHILLLSPQLPSFFSLMLGDGRTLAFDLRGEQVLSEKLLAQHGRWKALLDPPPTRRAALYYQLWQSLKPLPYPQQQAAIINIKTWAGVPEYAGLTCPPMSRAQLTDLSSNPLFTVGAHTVTHPALACHSLARQHEELQTSKTMLEQALHKPVHLLAYPYGNYNDDTLPLVGSAGFSAAFTTQAQAVTQAADPYRLGRCQVNNWTGAALRRQLRRWFAYY
ncbi:polysaccharide deacetylase family protein [Hymenobacter sp. BT188]|uniref:polysaccharide deacetylase family protein n=1 Tax=Hymenobacter sp. BT188 TaxID=2763504 RepID=UPI001650E4D3|nr:polysaccharide deacetylase family protein [Hymenobacter sp. BT188]MBC6609121.1 polysaccharide deacetylase family protein [Hymenobacter sp. BT188]